MTIEELLRALSPTVLRTSCVLPFSTAREAYAPRVATVATSLEMEAEVTHFIDHMLRHRYRTAPETVCWPMIDVQRTTQRVLWYQLGGWRSAMRHIAQGGMRQLFDALTTQLQQNALHAHLDVGILRAIEALSPDERLRLMIAYLDEFRSFGVALEHPAIMMNRWHEVLHTHARLVLERR